VFSARLENSPQSFSFFVHFTQLPKVDIWFCLKTWLKLWESELWL